MVRYVKNPLCPKCKIELDWDSTFDTNHNWEELQALNVGSCYDCGTIYRWISHYDLILTHHTDLEEFRLKED